MKAELSFKSLVDTVREDGRPLTKGACYIDGISRRQAEICPLRQSLLHLIRTPVNLFPTHPLEYDNVCIICSQ